MFFFVDFQVLVPIGFGTEEMEAVILVDVMRRAGAEVTVASVEQELEIEASGGTRLVADTSISSCSDEIFDLVALPVSFLNLLVGVIFCVDYVGDLRWVIYRIAVNLMLCTNTRLSKLNPLLNQ